MQQLKQTIDDFLKINVGLIPIKSTYVVHDDYEEYCRKTKRDVNSESFFVVRNLTSHLKADSSFLDLNFIHEHYGHGLFCEYSKTGKRLWQYEQDLASLEKEILSVRELPVSTLITITKDNPFYRDYINLRTESEMFFLENVTIYEAFAYWMEKWLGHNFCDKNRENNIPQIYKRLIELYEYHAKAKGVKQLLCFLEFE